MSVAKRCFDVVFAGGGLFALSPVFAGIALLIKLGDGGSVFFRQERVGKDGKPFRMWKFRSMIENAENKGIPLTVGEDARITRVGRFLRKSKLDELPQLLNVLAGEMSLVGPRPEVERYVARYTPEQRRVLELVPGITDLASIEYRDEASVLAGAEDPERAYIERIMSDKIRINLEYARDASVLKDFGVILRTFAKLI